MKKFIASFVAVLLAVTLVVPSALAVVCPSGNLGRQYIAPKGKITVDGEIDDAWGAAEWTKIDVPYQDNYDPENYDYGGTDCEAKVMWDDDAIYVLVQVKNETDVWAQDIMEIYIEQGEKTEGEYSEIGWQQRYQMDEDGEFEKVGGEGLTALVDDNAEICPEKCLKLYDDNKTAVMEFKYAILKEGGVKEGDVLGLEFMLEDERDLDGTMRATGDIFRWNICEVDENGETGVTRPYQESANFGDLILGAAAPVATEAPTAEPVATTGDTDADKTADAATAAPKDDASSSDNSWIWWVVGAVVVVAAGGAIFAVSKKKK